MASTYPAITAYLSPKLTPPEFVDDEAETLLSDSMNTGDLPLISASSRNGWIGGAVRNLANALDLKHLGFLYGAPWEHPGGRIAYLVCGEELAAVARDISFFFARAAESPERCSDWTELEPEKIATALTSPIPLTPTASYDDQPILFLGYLRALCQYCEYALQHGGSVLHVQWDGG